MFTYRFAFEKDFSLQELTVETSHRSLKVAATAQVNQKKLLLIEQVPLATSNGGYSFFMRLTSLWWFKFIIT